MLNASRDRIITSDRSSCIAVSPYCGTASISAVQASTENHQDAAANGPHARRNPWKTWNRSC